ncbi:DUF6587 family protein [Acetobacter orleanensis]|uniref:Uncharacterized protein n=1 Tax=Acetobacter orleanensis TaxID=104099 RepID=A0A4Y3TK45_9PROT|nr:DUF6587 family protein [Acetobacter orleanensis]KXV65224.1 hypothetical protein AD949_05015 [Acetobacter orleanensis]PCD79627.1 hypothetical protein CO710_05290 [Acetobacter orleanensis]GAN68724.1 hypothetical protein Abol_021_079 [Acetobacter orleanensis JCM 7639]GBR24539.1 hypothetical protein AA0473_0658 [Acetobacter orleanensis NRIC 0473]GEB82302.1 hypothetical protein AOR01nite_07790 [Acetobacter orleanensis]
MTQIILVTLIVLVCAAYWLQKLAPATLVPFWRTLAGLLRNTQHFTGLRRRAERLATPGGLRTGCGACKNCDGKKGGCH